MLQSALFRQRLVTFTVTQDILSNHGGGPGSVQSDSALRRGVLSRSSSRSAMLLPVSAEVGTYVLPVKATQKLTPGTKVSAASGELAGAGRCRSSSPWLFRVQTALGWIPVPGWAHRLSPSIPEAVCAQPGPAPDSISCGSWSSPPSTSVPTLRFRRTSQTVPVMFHCEGFTGEEGFEESNPWPISEGRAGGEDVERKRWLES